MKIQDQIRGSHSLQYAKFSLKISIEKQVLTILSILLPGNYTSTHAEYVGQWKNPNFDTRCRESNSGPKDCEADALPHNHRPHVV